MFPGSDCIKSKQAKAGREPNYTHTKQPIGGQKKEELLKFSYGLAQKKWKATFFNRKQRKGKSSFGTDAIHSLSRP